MKNKPFNIFDITDKEFDQLYLEEFQVHSSIHWTPLEVVMAAIDWLNPSSETKVLDIGSGVGKFNTIAAKISKANYIGVEMREALVAENNRMIELLEIENIQTIQSDIVNIDFSAFDAFYYYNPFCEQLTEQDLIDDTIPYSQDQFRIYEDYVINQFSRLPKRTKVVTYCSPTFIFPDSYELKGLMFEGNLSFWEKVK